MRARPDIQTAVAFLTKRVRAPDEHDWSKLRRLLKYLKGTMYMKLTLSVDNMNTIHWYVDAAYGAHMDLKGHTGMMMTLGRGATMSFSRGQKLNVKSSTECELVGIDDAIPQIMWGNISLRTRATLLSTTFCTRTTNRPSSLLLMVEAPAPSEPSTLSTGISSSRIRFPVVISRSSICPLKKRGQTC
jgi:hypothetical protein